jgi:hypothetical protein
MANQKVQKQIDQTLQNQHYQKLTDAVGVILSYDRFANTATVLISKSETDEAEEILKNVPCPTYIGVQMAAPEPGRPCVVIFRNGNITQPLITHYYNHRYSEFDYGRQSPTQFDIPTHLLG